MNCWEKQKPGTSWHGYRLVVQMNPGLFSQLSPWSYVLLGGRKRSGMSGKWVSLQEIPTKFPLPRYHKGPWEKRRKRPARAQGASRGASRPAPGAGAHVGKHRAPGARGARPFLTRMLLTLWSERCHAKLRLPSPLSLVPPHTHRQRIKGAMR